MHDSLNVKEDVIRRNKFPRSSYRWRTYKHTYGYIYTRTNYFVRPYASYNFRFGERAPISLIGVLVCRLLIALRTMRKVYLCILYPRGENNTMVNLFIFFHCFEVIWEKEAHCLRKKRGKCRDFLSFAGPLKMHIIFKLGHCSLCYKAHSFMLPPEVLLSNM